MRWVVREYTTRRTGGMSQSKAWRFAILIIIHKRIGTALATEVFRMKRRKVLWIAGAMSAYTLANQAQSNQLPEGATAETDPWVGSYLKYAKYDTKRDGKFGEAQTITVTKDRDGYLLAKPYDHARFTEKSKGVLSDGDGGLGKIFLGTVEYADGKKETVLRVEFCYEDFILYRETIHEKANVLPPAGK